jgi:hypothetical protein
MINMSKRIAILLVILTIISGLIGGAISGRIFTPKVAIAEETTQSKILTVEGLNVINNMLVANLAQGQSDRMSRPACYLCKDTGVIICPNCRILGRRTNCPNCKGKNWVKCPACRGTGKAIILSDIIPKNKQSQCGIHKLTPNEQYALMKEMYSLLNDQWDEAAGKYLEHEGWEKATVIRKSGDLTLLETEDGRELMLDDVVPSYGISVGSKIWLESTVGMIDIIDEDGDTGSYMVR